MDISTDSTMLASVYSYNTFLACHSLAYPDGSVETAKELYTILINIAYEWEALIEEYKHAVELSSGDFSLGLRLVYWLFHDFDFMENSSPLRPFVIERNDTSLRDTDYALLFYISLQGEEVQDATRDVPLPMLYDMFMPTAEENLNTWKATQ
jgi:hypothetical protein